MEDIQQDKDFDRIRAQLTQYLNKPNSSRRGWVYRTMLSMEGKYSTTAITEAILKLIDELGRTPEQRHLLSYWRDRIQGAPVIPILSSNVYGKWNDSQIVAEPLPLISITEGLNGFEVNLWEVKARERQEWKNRGFLMAEPFPVVRRDQDQASYVEISRSKWKEMASFGYVEAMPLQWSRRTQEPSWTKYSQQPSPAYADSREDRPGLYVDRSIISHGFWNAYKWWAGCRDWYYYRHPEWFWDDPIWGSEIVEAVFVPEGTAVLSPSSRHLFQRLNITG